MEWYLPITIVPGVGIIIVSTTNLLLSLNNEISQLELKNEDGVKRDIIKLKLTQLKKLSISVVFQYIGVLFFLFSGIIKAICTTSDIISKCLLALGVSFLSVSVVILLMFSIKAVTIRQRHLKI